MADVLWSGSADDKLYLQSGQFTSTLKRSEDIGGVDADISGISWDDTNTFWSGTEADKLYLQSGQFTSTLKESEHVGGIDTNITDISCDGTNTPWGGNVDGKLYLTSGQFTSTIKKSEYVGGVDNNTGISWDGTNTPWCGNIDDKLYLQSGQFTSTLKESGYVGGDDTSPSSISFTGVDTLWGGITTKKLFLTSGQFTSTIKDSVLIVLIENIPTGIETDDYSSRVPSGIIYEKSVIDTLTLVDSIIRTVTLNRSEIDSLILTESYNLIFIPDPYCAAIEQWPRWILASAVQYFGTRIENNGYSFFLDGQSLDYDEQTHIEFRMNGPNLTQFNPNFYRIDVEINLLWSFNQGHVDLHEPERIKGLLLETMDDFCIYRYGDGDSLLGKFQLKQNPIEVSNFGRILIDTQLLQGSVTGDYEMFIGCN